MEEREERKRKIVKKMKEEGNKKMKEKGEVKGEEEKRGLKHK